MRGVALVLLLGAGSLSVGCRNKPPPPKVEDTKPGPDLAAAAAKKAAGQRAHTAIKARLPKIRSALRAAPAKVLRACGAPPGQGRVPVVAKGALDAMIDGKPAPPAALDPGVKSTDGFTYALAIDRTRAEKDAEGLDMMLMSLADDPTAALTETSPLVVVVETREQTIARLGTSDTQAGAHGRPDTRTYEFTPGRFKGRILVVDVVRGSVICGADVTARNTSDISIADKSGDKAEQRLQALIVRDMEHEVGLAVNTELDRLLTGRTAALPE